MLTVPALIFLGLPPTVANGTNRVALLIQNIGAVGSFHRRGLVRREWLPLAGPPLVLGALLGTWGATVIDDASFQRALAVAMILVAAYTVWDPLKGRQITTEADLTEHVMGKAGLRIAFFLIGVYGGFIQIGVGFIILALSTSAGLDLVRGSSLKCLLVLTYSIPAIVLFSSAGKIHWPMGFVMAGGNFLGAVIGVRLAVRAGHVWIKRFVTLAVLILAGRLLLT